MWIFYLTGFIVGTCLGLFFSLIGTLGFILWEVVIPFSLFGLLAGFIGSFLDKRFSKNLLHKLVFIFLTIILSLFLPYIILELIAWLF